MRTPPPGVPADRGPPSSLAAAVRAYDLTTSRARYREVIADGAEVPAVLRGSHDALAALAPRWRGQPLADADRRTLALALGRSRFFAHAARSAPPVSVSMPDAQLRGR